MLSRLDKLPTKARPLDATKLALQLVGEQFEQNSRAIKRIRVAMQRAINTDRAFERGRVNSVSKISLALAEQEIGR